MPALSYQHPSSPQPLFRLVHFRTEWNGACQIVAMMLENLSAGYQGKVTFDTVDIEKDPELAAGYGITEVPTLLLLKEGRVIDHTVGMISRQELLAKIDRSVADGSQDGM